MQEQQSSRSPLFQDELSSANLPPSPVTNRTRSQNPPSYHKFRYESRRHIVARNNLLLNLFFQLLSMGLVLLTFFIGAWDCSTSDVDQKCDTLLTYHLGQGDDGYIQFGVNSLSACELASVDRSKCWNLGIAVSYVSIAISGLVYGVYGVLATILKIKGVQNQYFQFLLAVRIAHWIYLTAVGTWIVFTGSIAHFFKLGWCPYVLLVNSLLIGYIIGVHLRYWSNKLEMARLVNQLLAT